MEPNMGIPLPSSTGNLCDSDLIDQLRLQETPDGYAAVDIQVLLTLGG
jgi:hypothetical protein